MDIISEVNIYLYVFASPCSKVSFNIKDQKEKVATYLVESYLWPKEWLGKINVEEWGSAFHFVEIYHFVDNQLTCSLHLQKDLEFIN